MSCLAGVPETAREFFLGMRETMWLNESAMDFEKSFHKTLRCGRMIPLQLYFVHDDSPPPESFNGIRQIGITYSTMTSGLRGRSPS